jgi:Dyp-type peroxidase family
VRDQLRLTPGFDWAFAPTENHLDDAPKGLWSAARATLLSASVFATLTLVGLACWALTYYQLFYPTSQWLQFFMRVGAAFVLSLMGVSITLMIAAGVALIWLRRLETSDRPSSASISVKQLRALQEREDRAVQNHMTAVSVIKPGPLRRLMLRLTFYLISISATHVFKPGLLSSIGTIHFARWVSIPNTNRLVFLSNYGGSWESYLEDFIAKASKGLTGIWSNTEGYPVTRFLFFSGARDGDRFKRWARTQQVPTNFWYSAYPHLSTTLIRKNALIRSGIASAKLSEARDWINLFSSTERQEGVRPSGLQKLLSGVPASAETLEEGEIQSIAFGPMGRLRHGLMLGFRVIDDTSRACRKVWLEQLTRYLAFGDARQASTAAIAFFGPDGLRQLGLDGEAGNQLMGGFPLAFRQGMANPYRSRILDDTGPNDPQNWLWGADANPVDVIVNCYAATAQELDELVAGLEKMSSANGVDIVHRLSLVLNDAPAKRGERPKALDQFGFVDGISQPVLRGAGRDVGGMHEVNPGEFLFGYRDEHGFYPPTPTLPSSADPTGILRPINVEGAICAGPADVHDFGRNGSFVVVRQLQQHVELFDGYCAGAAGELSKQMRANVSPDWVGARIVGRWKDGSSLVRNPHAPGGGAPDNDFNFGADDPQGLKCPLGAHVRRSNPRGSLSNDLDTQLRITNRHRILRVGRTYIAEQGAMDPEKGLLFVCLNASIERQYEFIQQTWMAAGNFHGLRGEKDPLMGTQSVDEVGDPVGRLAIPRWEGSIALQSMPSFVTMRGGGYYFMPSRAALRYLASRLG